MAVTALRNIGLDALADALNDPLKRIIDSAYDRDYVGLVDEDLHDDVLAEFPHASSATPAATAARSVAPQTLDVADAAAGDGAGTTAESAPVEEPAGDEIDAGESESDSAVGDVDGGEARRTSGRQSERAHRHARHLPCLRVRQHFQVDKIYFPLRAVARSLTSVGLIPKREAR